MPRIKIKRKIPPKIRKVEKIDEKPPIGELEEKTEEAELENFTEFMTSSGKGKAPVLEASDVPRQIRRTPSEETQTTQTTETTGPRVIYTTAQGAKYMATPRSDAPIYTTTEKQSRKAGSQTVASPIIRPETRTVSATGGPIGRATISGQFREEPIEESKTIEREDSYKLEEDEGLEVKREGRRR